MTPRGHLQAHSHRSLNAYKRRDLIEAMIIQKPGMGSTKVFRVWVASQERKARGFPPVAIDQDLQWLRNQGRIEQRPVDGERYPGWFPKN